MVLTVFLTCALVGCLTGFLAGLLGIGGGLVIVPALVYLFPLFGFPPEQVLPMAVATSLASIVFTSASAAMSHHGNHNIPWKVAKPLVITIAPGAVLGAFLASYLPQEVVKFIFVVAISLLAGYMLFSIKVQKTRPMPETKKIRVIGLLSGCISSLMGISGGAILIPVLTYYSMTIRLAIGTATICGLVVASFGSVSFIITGLEQGNLPSWSLGFVHLPALLGLVLTSSLFARFGIKIAQRLPVRYLQRMFAGFLMLIAVKILFQ